MKGTHFVSVQRPNGLRRWYVYAWRGGPLIAKRDGTKKPSFTQREMKNIAAELKRSQSCDPESLRSLIREWRSRDPRSLSSANWQELPPGTKRSWGAALAKIDKRWGALPLAVWNSDAITRELSDWYTAEAMSPNNRERELQALSALLEFGRARGRLATNIAARVRSTNHPPR
jgi:hypothetical protein